MTPELVKFFEEYQDRILIRSYDLSSNPPIREFPVSSIPTQFIFDASGAPFRPTNFVLGGSYELLTDDDGTHILTRHVGLLTYDDMVAIYNDMASR